MEISKYKSLKEAVKASKLKLNKEQTAEINNLQKNIDRIEESVNFYLVKFDNKRADDVYEDSLYAIIDEYTFNMFGINYLNTNSTTSLIIIYKTKIINTSFYFGVSDISRNRKSNKDIKNIYLAIIDRCTFVNSKLGLNCCFNSNNIQTHFKMVNCTVVEGSDLWFNCNSESSNSEFYLDNVTVQNTKITLNNKVKLKDSSLSYLQLNTSSILVTTISTIGDDTYSVIITKAFTKSTKIFVCKDLKDVKDLKEVHTSEYDVYLYLLPDTVYNGTIIHKSRENSNWTLDINYKGIVSLILKGLSSNKLKDYINKLIETNNLTKLLELHQKSISL